MRISDVTDAELANRAATGDSDAFRQLVERYGPAVRRVARTVLRNPDDADDAAQDGFWAAWRSLDRYDRSRPFGPWLLRIVLNAARDLGRRRQVRATEPLTEASPTSGPLPDELADRAQMRDRLAAALSALPERQRLVVVLFEVEGYAHREIAQLLNVAEGTVRSDIFHARRALRAALGADGRIVR